MALAQYNAWTENPGRRGTSTEKHPRRAARILALAVLTVTTPLSMSYAAGVDCDLRRPQSLKAAQSIYINRYSVSGFHDNEGCRALESAVGKQVEIEVWASRCDPDALPFEQVRRQWMAFEQLRCVG